MNKKNENANSLNVLKGCTLETNCITLQDGQTAKISVENGKTKIMIEHKEEEPKFKKGDIIFLETQGANEIYQNILIVESHNKDNIHLTISLCVNDNELTYRKRIEVWFANGDIEYVRYATEEEKRTLFQAMLKQGMFWDENKMKVRTLKNGDIITTEECYGHTWYSIFEEIKDERVYTYSDLNDSGDLYHEFSPFADINGILSIRYSTTDERQTLFDKIEEQKHQKRNSETKDFENIKWRAKKGEIYWYLTENLHISSHTEDNDSTDNALGEVNNKFKTKELTEAAAVKIKELLSKL